MVKRVVCSLVVFGLAMTGCKKSNKTTGNEEATASGSATGSDTANGSDVATGSAAPTPDAAAPAGPKGVAAADNNKALVEIAQSNKGCKIDPHYPSNNCNDVVKKFEGAFDKTKDAVTVVNLAEEPTVEIRYVAVRALDDGSLLQTAAYRPFQGRLATAAAAETDPAIGALWGGILDNGDFKDAAYADAVENIIKTHELPQLRAALAKGLMVADGARFFPILTTLYASATDAAVKDGIIMAMYGSHYDASKVCPWALEVFQKETDGTLAGDAGYVLSWSSGMCKDYYDQYIDAYANWVASNKPDFQFVLKTVYMARAQGASDAQKAKFLDAAKKVVENTAVSGMARSNMLETIGKYAKDGKAFAKKFVNDKDSFVSKAAKAVK